MTRGILIVAAATFFGLTATPAESAAQEFPTVGIGARFRFPSLLRYRPNESLQPGGRLGPRIDPTTRAREWAEETRALVSSVRDAVAANRLMTVLGQFGTAAIGQRRQFTIAAPPSRDQRQTPLGVVAQVAELGIQMRSRVEMRFDRVKNERCTAFESGSIFSGCEAGFPAPSLDQQFQVSAGGLVSQRVNLNVDFDTEREFDANDDIRVWYQGFDDEILQRVEVGDVRFRTPASRFISSGIGGNSFGFQVEAELGPLEMRTVLAQQKGSSVRSRIFTVGDQVTQPVNREIPDLEYEAGRFFAVVDPKGLPGYPDVDLLNLPVASLPAEIHIQSLRVYRLRALGSQGTGNVETGTIDAIALRDDSDQRVGPFRWELLAEGVDYYVDPSLLWFGLSSRVADREFLAVSYITARGDTVGTFPSTGGELDTLMLLYEPERGPEVPTFYHELRNFYRIGGSDVERNTVTMAIVVNGSEQPLNGVGSYLSRLGMAQANDQNVLDSYNRVFPRVRDPNGGEPLRDLFAVFPHLTPFADSTRLEAEERNDSLYRTPTHLRDTQGPPSTLSMFLGFDSQGGGSRASLPLGALGIQPGSEHISVGNRQLTRGADYEIAYDIGVVNFLNPDSLFPGPTQVRVDFEEAQQFDADAKSLVGLALTYDFGSVSSINAVVLMQNERTQLLRPQLGFEPQAAVVGGLSANLDFRIDNLTRALDRLPMIETEVPSRITFNGEVAVSRPNPNRAGVAYVEDFEGTGGSAFAVLLNENRFQLGSRPGSVEGIDSRYLNGGAFADIDAVPLVWQNLIQVGFDALGFAPQDIDSTIVTVGAARESETVLWLTLKPDTVGGAPDPVTGQPRWVRDHTPGPRWRSVTQPFGGSGLGIDLSRAEFLEFWVLEDAQRTALANDAALIIDLGTVFEDAVAPAPATFRASGSDTTFSGLQFVGSGVLDTERDLVTNVFNAAVDDIGIHGDLLPSVTDLGTGAPVADLPLCETPAAAGIPIFPRGDLGAGCTRGNGLLDTEDLDSDNRLDVTVGRSREDVFRYVFPIGSERHFVRNGGSLLDGAGRLLQWRLYRIPLRTDSIQSGIPNIRQVRSMRLTMVTPDRGPAEQEIFIALSRMRFVGAPWLKRASSPIAGIDGFRGELHGEVVASIVTTENAADLGYSSPPGVRNEAVTAGAGLVFGSEQINEKSLRLIATDLRLGERAEAFERYTDNSDKNFLKYNSLRVWARGRGAGWDEGDLEFFLKVGRDEDNFYLYRAPARTAGWEPEIVIDLHRWLQLRAELEARWLRGEEPSGSESCGGSATAFVICDGPYVVHVENPGVAPPNLARVSEVAVGMIRVAETVAIPRAELWIDDIRLDNVVNQTGYAGAFDARFVAADVADVNWSYSRRDDQFRQLGQDPTYVGDRVSTLATSVRVDKFLPSSWGMNIPVTARVTSTRSDPFYLNRSDVLAEGIEGLRRPVSESRLYQVSVRRERRGTSFLERTLLDPINFFAQFQNSQSTQLLDESRASSHQVRAQYSQLPEPRTIPAVPGFVRRFVRSLPGFISNSAFGRALTGARLRWNPVRYSFSTSLATAESARRGFRVPVTLANDTLIPAAQSRTQTWNNQTAVDLRPFSTFNLQVGYSSTRDLQDYGDSTTITRLLQRERRSFGGRDVGFERAQNLTTQLNVQPVVASWIQPSVTLSSSYRFDRNPHARNAIRLESDTTGGFRLPETISNSRRQEYRSSIDLPRLTRGLLGDSSVVASILSGINLAEFSYLLQRRSSFDLFPFEAATSYRLGLGSLGDFLQQNGVPATSAQESREWTASGSGNLPLGARVDLNYSQRRTRTFSLRNDAHAEVVDYTRAWPSINLNWTYTPVFLRGVLTNISGFANYRRTESQSQPLSSGQVADEVGLTRSSATTALTPSLTFTWAGGLVTSARLTKSVTESRASGSLNRTEQETWTGSVAFNFRPPRSLVRLSSPLLTRLEYSSFDSNLCLQRADQAECISVSDNLRKSFSMTMDTGFSTAVRGGMTFSYVVTEQSTVSSKFSQIIFTVFAQINFFAGQLR